MLAIKGFYENGRVVIPSPQPLQRQRRMAVVVTFLKGIEESTMSRSPAPRYSFAKSRELLKECAVSLADAVVEERQNAI